MVQVTLIEDSCGEWEAIYLDGKKVDENHSISFSDFLRTLQNAGILIFSQVEVDGPGVGEMDQEFDPTSSFPDQLPQDLTTIPGFQSLT